MDIVWLVTFVPYDDGKNTVLGVAANHSAAMGIVAEYIDTHPMTPVMYDARTGTDTFAEFYVMVSGAVMGDRSSVDRITVVQHNVRQTHAG